MNVIELLFIIEKRKELYLGEGDLLALRHFVDGFCVCAQIHKIEYGKDKIRLFNDFVCNLYHEQRSVSLFECIVDNTDSKEEAFIRFFELLHMCFGNPPEMLRKR